jgi:hypothetical protein
MRCPRRHPRAPWTPPRRGCECRWRELRECVVGSPAAPCFPLRASRGRGLDRLVQRLQRWRDAVHRAHHGVARQAEGVARGSRTAAFRRGSPGHEGSNPVPSLRTTHRSLRITMPCRSMKQRSCQAPRMDMRRRGCKVLGGIAFGDVDPRLATRAPGARWRVSNVPLVEWFADDARGHRGTCLCDEFGSGPSAGFARRGCPYAAIASRHAASLRGARGSSVVRRISSGGGGEIRTHGRVAPSRVFKTRALNRSATPPTSRAAGA